MYRELLELAAKAAGIEVVRSRLDDPMHHDLLIKGTSRNISHDIGPWNPLTDDGDALRLVVKLMEFEPYKSRGKAPFISNDLAATRRAIVRAAAAIGETIA
jgi:hypothetical protein